MMSIKKNQIARIYPEGSASYLACIIDVKEADCGGVNVTTVNLDTGSVNIVDDHCVEDCLIDDIFECELTR